MVLVFPNCHIVANYNIALYLYDITGMYRLFPVRLSAITSDALSLLRVLTDYIGATYTAHFSLATAGKFY